MVDLGIAVEMSAEPRMACAIEMRSYGRGMSFAGANSMAIAAELEASSKGRQVNEGYSEPTTENIRRIQR